MVENAEDISGETKTNFVEISGDVKCNARIKSV